MKRYAPTDANVSAAEISYRRALVGALAATTASFYTKDKEGDARHVERWRERIRRTYDLGRLRYTKKGVHLANQHLCRWRDDQPERWPVIAEVLTLLRDTDTLLDAWEALFSRDVLPASWVGAEDRSFDVREAAWPMPYTTLNHPRETIRVRGNYGFVMEVASTPEAWPRRTITLSRGGVRRAVETDDRLDVFPRALTSRWPEPAVRLDLLSWASRGEENLRAAEDLAREVCHRLAARGVGPCTHVVWEFGPRLREDGRRIEFASDGGIFTHGALFGSWVGDAQVYPAAEAIFALWRMGLEFVAWREGAAVLRCPPLGGSYG